MNAEATRLFRLLFLCAASTLLSACQWVGHSASPPFVQVFPIERFDGAQETFGHASQVVVHRSIPQAKLEAAFPSSEGNAYLFSPQAVKLVKAALQNPSLSPSQRSTLSSTLSELYLFERRRRLAIDAAVPGGPARFRMLQRATFR